MDDDQETYITERTSVPSVTKRVSFPESIYPAKDPHSLQYVYNQLPDNGVPLATQYKQAKEQEKKSKKSFRKAAPGQGILAPLPERVPEFNENYYPYTYYNQVKQPDKPKLFHHTTDGQIVANDSLDLSQYIHEPNTSNPSTKRRRHRHHHHRKSHHEPPQPIFEATTPKLMSPIKDNTNIELKSDNKFTDLSTQSLSPNNKHKHHRHHHHHHHHHRHHHDHTSSPDKEYVDAEFKVIDVSFKKSGSSPFFTRPNNPFALPPPNIYNTTSYLPPISLPQVPYHSQSFNAANWQDSPRSTAPKNRSLDFYDRYLNGIIRNKLTADN